jgi:heme-degrading monooxygenase HmoA
MIARLWHGWTKPENADTYELLVATKVLPSFEHLKGYKGAYLLRDDRQNETEFVTLTLFEDLEAVRRFAGEDYQTAVVPPEARKLLSRFDERSKHYETVLTPS